VGRPTTSTKKLLEVLTGKKDHKYSAKATVVDGIRFASKKEARRYGELKLLQQGGKIRDLRMQVRYKLVQPVVYVADFVYREVGASEADATIVEDVKGYRTREYKAKKRLMAQQHNVEIREV
jgi:hypothetical protein